jgi:pimeloyl-ACP methyl ester carboxylesterase
MMQASQLDFHTLRGRQHAVRQWGRDDAQIIFCLHGWMDASITFQFVADALGDDWRVIAPDWRGFGASQKNNGPYWFADYYADFEALLDIYSPDIPVDLVGHSMGGNIACIYAGVRPQRVRRLISLDGFGMVPPEAETAPERMRAWLDEQRQPPVLRPYVSPAEFASRLQRINPRLPAERALFLAEHLGQQGDAGFAWTADPWHKAVNPVLYRLEEAMACWRQVKAPTMWVAGDESEILARFLERPEEWAARQACFSNFRYASVAGAGHMLHHDFPEQIAALIADFLRQ